MVTRIPKMGRACVIAVLAFASGAGASTHSGGDLSQTQVIRIADAEVQRRHRELHDFLPRTASYSVHWLAPDDLLQVVDFHQANASATCFSSYDCGVSAGGEAG